MASSRIVPLIGGLSALALAAVPDFYKRVDRVVWVVDDVDRSVAGWQKAGLVDTAPVREWADGASRFRWASGRFADIRAEFVQPVEGRNAFREFRAVHKQGIIGLLHRVDSRSVLDEEVERIRRAGAGVLQRGKMPGGTEYVLFDTEKEGKYTIGLVLDPEPPPGAGNRTAKISQYAFVARDLKAVSGYWQKLGFPEMSVTHPELWDLKYHDQPGHFDALLGWQRHGNVVYEWIQPLKGPTVYNDQMAAHGEGVHHLAFDVLDIGRASAEWTARGFPFIQGGAWGESGKPGYGRFAYQSTQNLGGTDVELLWNYRAKP